jgi:hypothetical protein
MKNIDLLPRQRINTLIDNLCKYAEIYEKDRKKFDDMKKMDIWDTFASEDYLYINEDTKLKKTKKISSRDSMLISTKTGLYYQAQSSAGNNSIYNSTMKRNSGVNNEKDTIFSDEQIRSLFFEFNLSILEAYDEKKHFELNLETQDHTFLHEKFIEDSKPEIRKFLLYILELPLFDILVQNMTHVVDNFYKHKNKNSKLNKNLQTNQTNIINPVLREAALIPNFDKTYKMIVSGINRRRKGKSIIKLIKLSTRIYNTISMPSPKFEKLPYVQNNIFIDPMHEEGINHSESLMLNNVKLDFGFMNYELKLQNEFYGNLLKDELNYIKSKAEECLKDNDKDDFTSNKLNTKNNIKKSSGNKDNTLAHNHKHKNDKESKTSNITKDQNFPVTNPNNEKYSKSHKNRESKLPTFNRESNCNNVPPTTTINNSNSKEKDLLNILRSITYEMNVKNPLTLEFKNYVLSNTELVKMYFGFILSKLRNLINKKNEALISNTVGINNQGYQGYQGENPILITRERDTSFLTTNNNFMSGANLTSLNALNATNATTSLNLLRNLKNFKREAFYNLTDKEDYIKNFNSFYDDYIKDKTNPMVEFHISFGLNFLTTISICDICKRPNTIWDIRKEMIFSKGKRESKTRCKFCENFFVPFFYILEEVNNVEFEEDEAKNLNSFPHGQVINKRKSGNINQNQNQFEFDENKDEMHLINDFGSISEKNEKNFNLHADSTQNKKLRKIEYMSFEHLMASYYDWDNDTNFDKNISPLNRTKKFPYNLFYNICLLMGEIKIRINDKSKIVEIFTLESYMKRHVKKDDAFGIVNPNENINYQQGAGLPSSSSDNVMKIFRDNYLKKKKELDEEKRKQMRSLYNFFPKKKKDMTKNKMVNIKFDLKDLMTEEKFNEFQKDLGDIPQFNKKNVVRGVLSTRDSKNTTGNNCTTNAQNALNASPFKPIANSSDYNTYTNQPQTNSSRIPNGRVSNLSRSKSKSRSKSPGARVCINLIEKARLDNHAHDREHYKFLNSKTRSKSKSRSKSRSRSPIRVSFMENMKSNIIKIPCNLEKDFDSKFKPLSTKYKEDEIKVSEKNFIDRNIQTVKVDDKKIETYPVSGDYENEISRPRRSRSPGKNRGYIGNTKLEEKLKINLMSPESQNYYSEKFYSNPNMELSSKYGTYGNNHFYSMGNNYHNYQVMPEVGTNKIIIPNEYTEIKQTNNTASLKKNIKTNKDSEYYGEKNNSEINLHRDKNDPKNSVDDNSTGYKNLKKKSKNSNFLKIFDKLAKDLLIEK